MQGGRAVVGCALAIFFIVLLGVIVAGIALLRSPEPEETVPASPSSGVPTMLTGTVSDLTVRLGEGALPSVP